MEKLINDMIEYRRVFGGDSFNDGIKTGLSIAIDMIQSSCKKTNTPINSFYIPSEEILIEMGWVRVNNEMRFDGLGGVISCDHLDKNVEPIKVSNDIVYLNDGYCFRICDIEVPI